MLKLASVTEEVSDIQSALRRSGDTHRTADLPVPLTVQKADFDLLFAKVYDELSRLARIRLAKESTLTQLDAPSLVHEVYLRLFQKEALLGMDRNSFFYYASTVMRSVVVDYVRQRQAQKRGAGVSCVTLDTQRHDYAGTNPDIESLEVAMNGLFDIDERCGQIVVMRYYGGLSIEEIAEVLQISPVAAWRGWEKARIFLFQSIQN